MPAASASMSASPAAHWFTNAAQPPQHPVGEPGVLVGGQQLVVLRRAVRRSVDIDIHQGRDAGIGVDAQLLHHDHAVVVHGPTHVDQYGPVRSAEDLAGRPRIQVLGFDDVWPRILPAQASAPTRSITVDTSVTALELAAAGDACAVVPERFARTAVRAGRVTLALEESWSMRQAHYLLRPRGHPHPGPQARAFLDWLTDLDQDDPPLVTAIGSPTR